MNIAIILSGGTGQRMGAEIPKQFIVVDGKAIMTYCMITFENHKDIDKIIIVCDPMWRDFVDREIKREKIFKFAGYADPGKTRQHSIMSGLEKCLDLVSEDSIISVHDSVRPLVPAEVISKTIKAAKRTGSSFPTVGIKDTIFYSEDGKTVSALIDRSKIMSGQNPESFQFWPCYNVLKDLSDEEHSSVTGLIQLLFIHNIPIEPVAGSMLNFKITDPEDLQRFILIVEEEK